MTVMHAVMFKVTEHVLVNKMWMEVTQAISSVLPLAKIKIRVICYKSPS